jgi:hypothetical protein
MSFSWESLEIISVLLDIVAFFCTVVDLYGEEGLNRTTLSLSAAMDSISTTIRQRIWEPFKKAYQEVSKIVGGEGEAPPEWLLVPIALVLVAAAAAGVVYLFGKITDLNQLSPGFLKYILMTLTGVGLLFTGFIVTAYTFLALLICFRGLMRLGLYLLGRFKFRGILLGVGALLFLMSKGIILSHLFGTLHK